MIGGHCHETDKTPVLRFAHRLLPTTVWISYHAVITQQPTAKNNYTVRAEFENSELTQGFQ